MKSVWLVWVVGLAACSKPNPAVCCISEEDCTAIGVTGELRECDPGLACVNNACVVPSCSTDGCAASAPVCDITTDVCTGCTDSSDCTRFADTGVCDPESGACVECVASTDCAAATPVCDANACRTCKLDSECASGACGDDGTCIDETAALYLDPNGIDQGSCLRNDPCKTLSFVASRAANSRSHIVLAMGTYTGGTAKAFIDPQVTSATRVQIHGHGSTFVASGDGAIITIVGVSSLLRDIHITNQGAAGVNALQINGPASQVEQLVMTGSGHLDTSNDVTIRDSSISNATTIAISSNGKLTIDRVTISGGAIGVQSSGSVDITNLLVFRTTGLALDLGTVTAGVVRFSTIADSGSGVSSGPRAFLCNGTVSVESSIIWAPGGTPAIGGSTPSNDCPRTSTIAGPTAVTGASNSDPLFVNEASNDFHLSASSPAIDMAPTGPALDFEGDARPAGNGFDIGADETH